MPQIRASDELFRKMARVVRVVRDLCAGDQLN